MRRKSPLVIAAGAVVWCASLTSSQTASTALRDWKATSEISRSYGGRSVAVPSPDGRWVVVGAPDPWVLLELGTGRPIWSLHSVYGDLGAEPPRRVFPGAFSADGRRAVWLTYPGAALRDESSLSWRRYTAVVSVDLDSGKSPVIRFEVGAVPHRVALSGDGRYVMLEGELSAQNSFPLAVYELETGRRVVSVIGDTSCDLGEATFVGTKVRAFRCADKKSAEVLDIDATTGEVQTISRLEMERKPSTPVADRHGFVAESSGDRLLELSPTTAWLRHGRTAEVVSKVPLAGYPSAAELLADGRIAVLEKSGRLKILAQDGKLQAEVQGATCIGGQPAAERLFVCDEHGAMLVDTSNGRVLRRERGITPVAQAPTRLPVASEGTRLFIERDKNNMPRALVAFDLQAGVRRPIVPAPRASASSR
jgi:hypothetical protein